MTSPLKPLSPKQLQLLRKFMKLKLHQEPPNSSSASSQSRYQNVVKLVAKHFPTNTPQDKQQFRQILVLLRELKDRNMTGDALKESFTQGMRESRATERTESTSEKQKQFKHEQQRFVTEKQKHEVDKLLEAWGLNQDEIGPTKKDNL